jgi:hypothetical protein
LERELVGIDVRTDLTEPCGNLFAEKRDRGSCYEGDESDEKAVLNHRCSPLVAKNVDGAAELVGDIGVIYIFLLLYTTGENEFESQHGRWTEAHRP